jgi:hypothetical protein
MFCGVSHEIISGRPTKKYSLACSQIFDAFIGLASMMQRYEKYLNCANISAIILGGDCIFFMPVTFSLSHFLTYDIYILPNHSKYNLILYNIYII